MKVLISKSLVDAYKESNKNYNYSLDFLLSSLDTSVCSECMDLVKDFFIDNDKKEIEIDDSNIKSIISIFGSSNSNLIERLLWVAILFPEI